MSQEFNGPVTGDVAGRDVVNITTTSSRLLLKTERRTLNNLVKKLEVEYGDSGAKTWKSIHDILGVDNIEFMRLEHYGPTETILNLLIQNAQLRLRVEEAFAHDRGGDDADLISQLNQSAGALTKSTQRNAELTTKLKQYDNALAALDTKSKRQASEIEGLTSQLDAAVEKSRRLATAQTSIAKARKRFAVATTVAVGAAVFATVLGAQNFSLSRQLHTAEERVSVCEFEDKSYAVGSVLPTGYKCVIVGKSMPPQWSVVAAKPDKKIPPPRRPSVQKLRNPEDEI